MKSFSQVADDLARETPDTRYRGADRWKSLLAASQRSPAGEGTLDFSLGRCFDGRWFATGRGAAGDGGLAVSFTGDETAIQTLDNASLFERVEYVALRALWAASSSSASPFKHIPHL